MMQLTEKQQAYLDNANHRWNIKSGAVRAGKTFLDITKVIPIRLYLGRGKDGINLFLGNTQGTLQRNIIEPMQEKFGKLVGNIGSDNTATIFGEKVYCIGADSKRQVNIIRGMSAKYCYGDEVATYNKDVFTMLKSRLDKEYSCCDLTCNAEDPLHWFKKFIDSDADIYLQEYTLDENLHVPLDFKEALKKEYAGTVWYDRYILGKWVAAEGLVYPMFSKKEHVFDGEPKCDIYHISVDYGTMNPFSAGLWGRSGGIWWRTKGYYHDGRKTNKQLTTGEYYDKLVELAAGKPIQSIIIDPSATYMVTEIRRRGEYAVRKAKNSVIEGIQNTAMALNNHQIMFNSSCEDCINEFYSYRWDEKSGTDKPIEENDHAMDETRYFVNTILYNNSSVIF